MNEIEIKDLPQLADWAATLVKVARGEEISHGKGYTLDEDGTKVEFNLPLVKLDGPLKERLFQAFFQHPATFRQLLEERGLKVAAVDDVKCDRGYFYVAILHDADVGQVCIEIHSDPYAWAQLAEDVPEKPVGKVAWFKSCYERLRSWF